MEDPNVPPNASDLKMEGNECVQEEKYAEAILLYTQAIKLDPTNYVLFSNRSYAFLQMDQHFLAFQDANETIRLEPQWPKGYFRRAEVEAASGLYDDAIVSYSRALQLQPDDTKLIESIENCARIRKDTLTANENILWISTVVGLITGLSIVLADQVFTQKPSITNPIVMVVFAIVLAGAGYGVGLVIVMTRNMNAGQTLQPPQGFDSLGNPESPQEAEKRRAKYSRAQARHRYKQGKL